MDQLQRIRVFVSCPEDMQSQSAIVEGTARDLSPLFEDTKGLTIKVLNWRRDAAPGIDADPQARLNAQLRYDIYIGLLGTRFGQPTPRAGSGTEDEFEQAYKSYLAHPTAVRLLFYFKKDVADISTLDLAQLGKVQEFRRRLSILGVLYGDYTTGSELEDLLKQHFRLLLTSEWDQTAGAWKPGAVPSPISTGSTSATVAAVADPESGDQDDQKALDDDDAPGALDYAVELEASTAAGAEALTRLTEALNTFNAALEDKTARANVLASNKAATAKQKQELADATADDLRAFGRSMATDGAQFRATFDTAVSTAFSALAAAAETPGWDPADCLALDTQLASLSDTLRTQRDQTMAFANSTGQLPDLTRHVRAAKRLLSRNLAEHVLGLTQTLDRTLKMRRQIRELPGGDALPPLAMQS